MARLAQYLFWISVAFGAFLWSYVFAVYAYCEFWLPEGVPSVRPQIFSDSAKCFFGSLVFFWLGLFLPTILAFVAFRWISMRRRLVVSVLVVLPFMVLSFGAWRVA